MVRFFSLVEISMSTGVQVHWWLRVLLIWKGRLRLAKLRCLYSNCAEGKTSDREIRARRLPFHNLGSYSSPVESCEKSEESQVSRSAELPMSQIVSASQLALMGPIMCTRMFVIQSA